MTMHIFFRAEGLPVFQNRMYRSLEEALGCPTGTVELVQDTETGLIYNQAFQPELMVYGSDYQNEQAVSGVFQRHLKEVAVIIERHFKGQTLIEVGCGKGYFLENLLDQGFSITGLDPAYEGESINVVKSYFTREVGLHADAIILRHVLEHVLEPVEFLRNICKANGGKGNIYIEVPCFDWICEQRAWFDVFFEHVNYFRLADFKRMFGTVLETGHIFGGQYLYVVADLASIRQPRLEDTCPLSFPTDFLTTVRKHAGTMQTRDDKANVVWGGASKGLIFSLYMQRSGGRIDYVVDINPAKQGKYLGATGLLVSAPGDVLACIPAGSNIFVMNSNYLGEICAMTDNRFNYLAVDHE